MAQMPSLKAKELIKLIGKYGWQRVDQTGSHAQFGHSVLPGKITIERHDGKDLPTETVRGILQQAGMDKYYRMLLKGSGLKVAEHTAKDDAAKMFAQSGDAPAPAPQLQPT